DRVRGALLRTGDPRRLSPRSPTPTRPAAASRPPGGRSAPARSAARARGARGSPATARPTARGSAFPASRGARDDVHTCTLTSFRFIFCNSFRMINKADRVAELRHVLRTVMRGLWARRRPTSELLALVGGARLGRRHVALLAHVGTEGERSVGELARDLGLSLPAASTLARELEEHGLLERREDPADRRRTVVALAPATAEAVRAWLAARARPLERALAALTPAEQEAFLKGLHALADALMEESPRGPLRSHHRGVHRRRPHPDRPV